MIRAIQPLIEELKGLGFEVETLADLRHQPRGYTEAIPVLLYWLSKVEDKSAKDEIARCLTVKRAAPLVGAMLVTEFLKCDDALVKWTIGNALSEVADRSILKDLLAIVRDKRHGRSRQMIVVGLSRFPEDRVYGTLLRLLDDPEVSGHAVIALGRLRYAPAREKLIPFLKHEKAWIRRKAKTAIAAIDAGATKKTQTLSQLKSRVAKTRPAEHER